MTLYKFLVGFVLTVAMVSVLGLTALLFAARDFQYGLALTAPASNGLFDENAINGSEAMVSTIVRDTTTVQLVHDIADLEARAHVQNSTSVVSNTSAAALGARVEALARISTLSADDQAKVAEMRTKIPELAAVQAQAQQAPAPNAATPVVLQAQSDAQHSAAALLSGDADGSHTLLQQYQGYSRVRTELAALHELSPWGIGSSLARAHPSQLSIALVMLMGALGALLYLFPAYLTRPVPVSMAEVVVRLIFGACAALAFYILANAGVAAFSLSSDSHQPTTSAALNPFTVSLIGIIAGVMAEDIAKWIQDRGRGIFQQGGPTVSQAAQAVDSGFTGVNPHGGPGAP
jgi:hypothetical protein